MIGKPKAIRPPLRPFTADSAVLGNMSLSVPLLSMTLLLALVELTVCTDGKQLPPRDVRSTYLSRYQQQYPQLYQNPGQPNLEEIFTVGTEDELVLFNGTAKSNVYMQADESVKDKSSTSREQPFKTTPRPRVHVNPPRNNIPPPAPAQNDYDCKERREGKPYCLNVPNYLELTQLNKISKTEFTKFEALFGEDVVQPLNITHRMNDEPDEIYHCESKATTIFPRQGETRDAGWMYIVNNDDYKQGVLVELCERAGVPCKFSENLPAKYTSMCKQHYIYRVLVAVHPNQTMTKEHFKIPSCCKCALRQHGF